MAKEEATYTKKYSKWRVFDKNGESLKETSPMTPSKAMKYFGATGVMGIE